jgi:DNA-binding transcriptional ArsR family regulator
MNSQLPLFEGGEARKKEPPLASPHDPLTSHEAARALVASGALSHQRQEVLDALKRFGPCTACELAAASGIDRFTASRRLPELAYLEKVQRLEARKCRVRSTKQTVWQAC